MKTLKLLSLLASVLISGAIYAQDQTITMKDGTVYEGYISNQDYRTGKGRISYSRMTRTIPVSDIQSRTAERRNLDTFSPAWQSWAEENNKVEFEGKDKKYLSITRMAIKNQPVRDYYVLVSGSKYYTVFTISDGVDDCVMSDIASIRKKERENTLLTDVDDIVQTDGSTFTGVILEQIPGKSFTVWNKADKSVHHIDYGEVRSIGKARFNNDYSIWKQTPYLDKITLKNRTTGKGLIVENGFGEDITILFADKAGDGMDVRQYHYADILSVERFRNPDFEAIYDIVLDEGESRIGRDSVLVFADIKTLERKDAKLFYLDPGKLSDIAPVKEKDIVIETNTDGIADIYIAKAVTMAKVPVSVISTDKKSQPDSKAKKNKKKGAEPEETVDLLTYSYQTLFESNVDYTCETSINGTTKITFTLPEEGVWFVFLRKVGKCWVISYKK